ncbi:MAG: MerR family transcriptional regulator [Halothiobacillus sp.]|jgi:chaperone modulatory protein CbpM|nr:MerR family transcriptional regulator [Halothiobacillus sp.]
MSVKYSIIRVHHGHIIDEQERVTLMQLSRICQLQPEHIIEMVDEGILEPDGMRIHAWRFPFASIEKVRKVVRLQRDLRINLAGAALTLHLLDRIAQLEASIRR